LAGLDSRYRGSQRRTRTAEGEARILEATRRGPTDGTTHWRLSIGLQGKK
jgi:hypothetical protein